MELANLAEITSLGARVLRLGSLALAQGRADEECYELSQYYQTVFSIDDFVRLVNLRLFDGRAMSVAHRTNFKSLLAFQVTLTKELLHDAVCPLTVEVQRLGRVAEVGAMHQCLQNLTSPSDSFNHRRILSFSF